MCFLSDILSQLMRHRSDEEPIVLELQTTIASIEWSSDGKALGAHCDVPCFVVAKCANTSHASVDLRPGGNLVESDSVGMQLSFMALS